MQYYFPYISDISIDKTLAIDFGTTNTTVFVVRNNRAEAVQIDGNSTVLPSVVSYGLNDVRVGTLAKNNYRSILKVSNIKRLAGLKYDKNLEFGKETFGCDVTDSNGQLAVAGESRGERIEKTVEEVISDIFAYIKHTVERKFVKEYKYLVLTVPSTYRSMQKKVIRSAAIKAGFVVACMLSEPTAAGIHYRHINFVKDSSVFLVFDFGGGTLDLSLVSCEGNKFEVLANGGNSHLGGADVDEAIYRWVQEQYLEREHETLVLEKRAMQFLRQTIVQKKQELSEKDMVNIDVGEDDGTKFFFCCLLLCRGVRSLPVRVGRCDLQHHQRNHDVSQQPWRVRHSALHRQADRQSSRVRH